MAIAHQLGCDDEQGQYYTEVAEIDNCGYPPPAYSLETKRP
jgi:hypothetical protein